MANYVTSTEIVQWLGVDSSAYDSSFLDSLITEKMGYVNRLTDMCWNGETRKVKEKFSLPRWKGGWILGKGGYPIHLSHSNVTTIHSLKVWNGDEWEEWVGSKTEARDGDYWVDYEGGVVYILRFLLDQGGKEVEITYSYGRTDLPYEVKELTKLLVIRDLLITERGRMALIEGDTTTSSGMLDRIEKRIKELEAMLRAYRVVNLSTPQS